MRLLKRYRWKAGIALAGMLLLLVLMVWIPVSAAGTYEGASGLARPVTGTVQATPTEDATVTALNKEKLQHDNDWWWTNGATVLTSLISTLTLAAAGIFTVVRYFNDRQDAREKQEAEAKRLAEDRKSDREKRAEERFQAAVEGLGSEREEAKVGAAITLRTFLRLGYEQFYIQTFDLAVAHLRLPRSPHPPEDPNTPLSLTTLSQALIVVFREAYPLAQSQNKGSAQALDAADIQLDNAYLEGANLKQVWMPRASLRGANLWWADVSGAILWRANLSGARLRHTNFSDADLWKVNFSGAELKDANLSGAKLSKANLEDARSLQDTDLRGAIGLSKEQLEACKAKGAIIDEVL